MREKRQKKTNKHFLWYRQVYICLLTTENRRKLSLKAIFLLATCNLLLVTFLSGCAIAPVKQALPVYNINGVTYVPLNALCEQRGVNFTYDIFTKTATLIKEPHRINLMAGESIVVVDGAPRHLKHPVDTYNGTIVVPKGFIEQVMDAVFVNNEAVPDSAVSYVRNIKTIVVDAGHGGYDPGAIGKTGLREKNVNLDVANRLAKILSEEGFKVVMTRSSDDFVSLEKRVKISNAAKADLFISIHSNANTEREKNGFEVYHVSTEVSDLRRAKLSADSVVSDLDKADYEQLTSNLKTILWDMVYTASRAESVGLAQSICRAVNNDLSVNVIGVKEAAFQVLKGAHMPAVLVEIGFVSNEKEEHKLRNTVYRQQITDAIAQGIKSYARRGVFAEKVKQ